MGLLDLLQNQGSSLTAYDGITPSINPLATPQSQMHTGYSINGTNVGVVNGSYQQYLDGANNNLPTPSQLDINGTPPTVSPSGQGLPYLNNLPG
jgi:hypothetical protein